jgi:hypothetical protein
VKWIAFLLLIISSVCAQAQVSKTVSVDLTDNRKGTLLLLTSDDSTAMLQVVGADGLFLTGLEVKDFLISRNGELPEWLQLDTLRRSDSLPLRVAFVLDNSESMFDAFDSLTVILDTFITRFHAGFEASVTLFDNEFRNADHYSTKRDRVFIAQRAYTTLRDSLRQFWHGYDSIRSRFTPLYDALGHAIRTLMHDQEDTRADVVIAVSDGADNASLTSLESLRKLFARTGVRLFTVNYRSEVDPKLLYLGRDTHGAHFSADGLGELREILLMLSTRLSPVYKLRFHFPTVARRSNTLRSGD